MFYDDIKNFSRQLDYKPEIINAAALKKRKHKFFVVAGMGGSRLPAMLLKTWKPGLPLSIHNDYGLPQFLNDLKHTLFIASSYSGNTEETCDFFQAAGRKNLPRAVVAFGGKLLALAQKEGIPYIKLPEPELQPRMAVGLNLLAILKLLGEKKALSQVGDSARSLRPLALRATGQNLAAKLYGKIPIIYSSIRNAPVAYSWKVKFNETAKIPAFTNVVPELNHNEMNGFGTTKTTKGFSDKFHFIFLRDAADHPKILKRMEMLKKLYEKRGFPIEMAALNGKNVFQKIFSSLVLADWTTYYLAGKYKVDPERVPVVEEFKRLMIREL